MTTVKVTYDDGQQFLVDVDDVFTWREWSQFDADKVAMVACGDLRRFSTSNKFGEPCDLEPVQSAE